MTAPGFGVRRSRTRRFLGWPGGLAISIATAGAIVAIAIWLGLA